MNYLDEIAKKIGEEAGMEGSEYYPLARIYAVLCLAKGRATTLEDVHDAWSAFTVDRDPEHKSLIPFSELTKEVQELDRDYMEAIREVAGSL